MLKQLLISAIISSQLKGANGFTSSTVLTGDGSGCDYIARTFDSTNTAAEQMSLIGLVTTHGAISSVCLDHYVPMLVLKTNYATTAYKRFPDFEDILTFKFARKLDDDSTPST